MNPSTPPVPHPTHEPETAVPADRTPPAPTSRGAALLARWAAGEHVQGVWSCLPDPVVAEIVAHSGVDYVCLDAQHGLAGADALVPLLQVLRRAPVATFVRVPSFEGEHMMRALDLGATGVIVPLVDTPEQAAAAVAACRYPPHGRRSWGPMWGDVDGAAASPEEADAGTVVAVMVETAEGLANVEAIAAVPGLDAIYVGPNDLALGTGHGRGTYADTPAVHEAVERVVAACRAHGIAAGLHCSTPEMAAYWAARGVQMLTVATDTSLVRAATQQTLDRFTAARTDDAAASSGGGS